MTASYPPALKVSDDPATAPNEKAFVSGGGGAPAFDIDGAYTAGIVGDFFDSQTTLWTDSGKTDPADTAGDAVYHWDGGRSAGTSLTATQSGAAFRVGIVSDATYGNVVQNVGAALKEQFANHGASTDMRLSYARVRYSTLTASSADSFSCITQSSGGSNGIAFYWDNTAGKYKFAYSEGATDIFSGAIEDTDWHTVVGVTVGTSMSLYVDDMTTPVATGTGTVGNSTRSGIQSQSGFQATTYTRRWGFADDDTIATPAQLASWLEAS